MSVENRPGALDQKTQTSRDRYHRVLKHIFRQEISPIVSGLEEAKKHVEEGGGLIVYANHFDQPDPLHVLMALYSSHPVFANTKMVVPLAHHQKYDEINLRGRAKGAGVDLNLIVTERSVKKYEARKTKIRNGSFLRKIGPVPTPQPLIDRLTAEFPKYGEGQAEFAKEAIEALRNGNIVYEPTQPERSAKLDVPDKKTRPLGLLASVLAREKVKNVGILFTGVSLNGVTDYGKYDGFNFFRSHKIVFGGFYRLEDAIEQAGGTKNLDEWSIKNNISHLVSPQMLSKDLRLALGK